MANVMKMLFNQVPHYIRTMVVRVWWFIVITKLECIFVKITISRCITMAGFQDTIKVGCAK